MYMNTFQRWRLIAVATLSSVFTLTQATAEIDPSARALVESMQARLSTARTVRLTAEHKMHPALGVGTRLEKGPLHITLKRPNQFHILQSAGDDTRELAFDGRTLCLMQPVVKLHALEALKAASVEQFADAMDARFGFRPPVAELLSGDVSTQLFLHVTSARVTGTEWVGWTRCERLHFEQDGMTGDLWIGKKDRLPRRYLLTFTGMSGHPTWDIRLTKWELNIPVDETLFSKRAAPDSQKVPMLKAR